jgi:2,3,4,5-tetrahydropyridine-2-carboxylate N-succinyltransferase
MGTLSGGNNTVVSVGEDCLQEANSGLGIPIGDRVRVAVGDYIKGSTLVRINRWGWEGNSVAQAAIRRQGGGKGTTHFTIKASELAGISDAVFRRNDKDGVMEVIPRGSSTWGSLNEALHDN